MSKISLPSGIFRQASRLAARARRLSPAQIIGPVVLAIGLMSVLGVVWMLIPASAPQAQRPDVVSFLEKQRAWRAAQPTTEQLAAQAAQTELARSMEGLWITRLAEGTAALTVASGVFQVIYYPSVGTIPRRYQRGVIEVKHGLAILSPREDLGAPDPVIADGLFFPYEPITRRTFALHAKREGENLIWEKGAPTVSNVHGTESFYPLFSLAPEGKIV